MIIGAALKCGVPIDTQAQWLKDEIWVRDPFQREGQKPCWQRDPREKPLDAEEIWGDSPT